MSRRRSRLSREVIVLGWVSFFNDVSSEMIYPLLPLFVVAVLDTSATSLGWVEGVAQATVAVLTAWVGWRSDRFRRRVPYVRLGYGIPVAGKAILVGAVTWPMVLLGRTVDRIGKGIRSSPRDALIADTTPAADRGRAFGLHRALDSAGAVVGVVAAAGLLYWLTGSPAAGGALDPARTATAFRVVFGVAAVLGLAALGLTLILREPAHGDTPAAAPPPGLRAGLGALSRRYWLVLALFLVFSIANSSDTFLLLRAAHLGLAPWEVVLAYALYSLVYTLVSYPAGALSDRVGRWRLVALGWAIYAGAYFGLAVTAHAAAVWPLLAVYGVYIALTDGVGKALLADHAPRERRGLALGLFYMASGVTTLASSVIAGALWDRVGPAAPFWFGGLAALAALALLAVVRPWRAAPDQRAPAR